MAAADPKRPETGGASAGIDTGIEYTYVEDELAQGVPQKEARSGPIGMVSEENISAWRRTVAGDLTSIFRSYPR